MPFRGSSGFTAGVLSGQYYPIYGSGSDVTTSPGQNVVSFVPFPVWGSLVVSSIGVEVTTLVAATTGRLGIYRDNGKGQPGALIIEAPSVIDTSTAGPKEVALASPISLSPGLYWLALVSQGGVGGVGFRGRGTAFIGGFVGETSIANANITMWAQAGVAGALPAAASGLTTIQVTAPKVYLKAA
jgi:hypothetical protein